MSKEKIKAKGIVESDRAIALFEEILNLMKEGGAHFEHDGQSVDLKAGEAVKMEIEVKHKDGKQKLEFEMVWNDDLGEMSDERMRGLKVSSKKMEEPVFETEDERAGPKALDEPPVAEAALF